MDGLLLDSERLARDAFVVACKAHGWQPDLEVYGRCIGSTVEATERILRAHFGPEFPYSAVELSWNGHYDARLAEGGVPLKAGALEVLGFLEAAGIPRALATSTRRPTTERKLEDAGIHPYFRHKVCGGETPRGKPNPEPFLAAAALLALEPAQCWALEDSENGVRAARAAGCVVIQIPDLVAPGSELRALGHLIVESLTDVLHLLEKNC
jgi:HAD superfamily hydrolase (TIGR01509 family)